jgi:hypothetical protein
MRSEKREARGEGLRRLAIACLMALATSRMAIAAPFSFDDIEFWVGTGANRAALVIDWVEESSEPPALVWGYRWDGTARGSDMLVAIIAADPRVVAKLGGAPGNADAVYGLGYDTDNDNNDESFPIEDIPVPPAPPQVTRPFDANGFFYTGPADGEVRHDPADYYAEGWFTGFWHYGVALENPYNGGSWSDTEAGFASRILTDGAWDSWAFTPTFNFTAFAENPVAALPPDTLTGDYTRDGRVDAADYVVWRKIDGSQQGYASWRQNFGASAGAGPLSGANVPEPNAASLVAVAVCLFISHYRGKRQ